MYSAYANTLTMITSDYYRQQCWNGKISFVYVNALFSSFKYDCGRQFYAFIFGPLENHDTKLNGKNSFITDHSNMI